MSTIVLGGDMLYKEKAVFKIREFNRYYLPLLSLLEHSYLKSEYNITESRILFEIYQNKGCNAKDIAEDLHIDKSYLSRILKRLSNKHLLIKRVSESDSRFHEIRLSEKGIEITENLIEQSNLQIKNVLGEISEAEAKKLIQSLETTMSILSKNGRV